LLSEDEHDHLAGRFYESAMGDAPWRDTIEQLASAFGTYGSLVQVLDSSGQVADFETYPFSRTFAAKFYASELYKSDPRIQRFELVRPGSVYFDDALFDIDEMNCSARVRACNDALGAKYSMGAVTRMPDGARSSLALMSTEAQGHASRAAIAAFRRLAPHWAQAQALGQVLEQRAATQDALLEALAKKADGIILLDRSGAPIFMNDFAQGLLSAGDGLAFGESGFATRRSAETRKLQSLIHDAISSARISQASPRGQMLITRPSGRHPYAVRVMGTPPNERFRAGAGFSCVIHVHDLAAARIPSKQALHAIFGLSEREADFAIELVRCASLGAAAAACGMALNTARNHLQSIFRKSGTNSQAEAVQLLTRLS
jgi:DNA-binding CsgD family transcriptional regulator